MIGITWATFAVFMFGVCAGLGLSIVALIFGGMAARRDAIETEEESYKAFGIADDELHAYLEATSCRVCHHAYCIVAQNRHPASSCFCGCLGEGVIR